MKKRLTIGALAIGALLLATISAGWAHEQTSLDPDDSPGPLDIVAKQQRDRTSLVRNRLVTYEKWTDDVLSGNHNFISFEFNLDRDPVVERCVVITNGDTELTGTVYKNCIYFDDEKVGDARVGRPDEHTVNAAFARDLLRENIRGWRWRAVTSFEEQGQNSPCPAPTPHGDGGYGACKDSTVWRLHKR